MACASERHIVGVQEPAYGKCRFKYLVTEMLCPAAGGLETHTGLDMASVHRHLKIRAGEWDAFMANLDHKLDKFNVPVAERA